MKFLKLAFIYKKHDTLRYMTFLYTKSQTLCKKQDNLRYVFIYKTRYFCAVFHWIFEICGGGGAFIKKKDNVLCLTFLYWKKQSTLHYVARYKEPDTMRYILISKKQYTLSSGIFHENFQVGIYTKSMTLCVTWRFYIQKARHFAKTKTIYDRFLDTNIWHFALRDFLLNFWN